MEPKVIVTKTQQIDGTWIVTVSMTDHNEVPNMGSTTWTTESEPDIYIRSQGFVASFVSVK